MRRSVRRWARRVLGAVVVVALGLATSVGVAWGVALSWKSQPADSNAPDWCELGTRWNTGIGGERCYRASRFRVFLGGIPKDVRYTTAAILIGLSKPERMSGAAWPGWGDIPADGSTSSGAQAAFGWPVVALWHEYERIQIEPSEGAVASGRGSLQIPPLTFLASKHGSSTLQSHSLPLGVVRAGMAIDTLVFAGAWWIVLAGPRSVRRGLRRRRGACLGCGYDLKQVPAPVCPECGVERKSGGVPSGQAGCVSGG